MRKEKFSPDEIKTLTIQQLLATWNWLDSGRKLKKKAYVASSTKGSYYEYELRPRLTKLKKPETVEQYATYRRHVMELVKRGELVVER